MEVRCKQRFCLYILRYVFEHRPCNGKSVESGRSAPDFVENEQARRSCIIENGRDFYHFHHERTLTATQIVACPDTCENSVRQSDLSGFCRYETSDMRHKRDNRNLSHISALTRHVRTRDNHRSVVGVIQKRVVWHVCALVKQSFDDGMTSAFYVYALHFFVYHRLYVIVCHGYVCK